MKNIILKWGDFILEFNCGVLILLLSYFCNNYYKIQYNYALTEAARNDALVTAWLAWFVGMNIIVFSFYFVFSIMDMRNNLSQMKKILERNESNGKRLLIDKNDKQNEIDLKDSEIITFGIGLMNWLNGIISQFKKEREEQQHLTIRQAVYDWWNGKYEGRCSLAEYWVVALVFNLVFGLIYIIQLILQSLIYGFLGNDSSIIVFLIGFPIGILFLLIFIISIKPMIAMVHRRLKDFETSLGVFQIIILLLIPLVNLIFTFVLLFKPGTIGKNKFGEPSKYYIDIMKLFTDWDTPIIKTNENFYSTDYEIYSSKTAKSEQKAESEEVKQEKEDLTQSIYSLCKNIEEIDFSDESKIEDDSQNTIPIWNR